MIDFSNKKKQKTFATIICIVLVAAMVIGLLVTSVNLG